MQEKDEFYALKSDGSTPYCWSIPKDHPIMNILLDHIKTIELQNELLCKIVGPKIAKQIRKNVKPGS